MITLSASVGEHGKNLRDDVLIVQSLLISKGYDLGRVDGICGPRTIAAIRKFQASFLSRPDGLVEVRKMTWIRLSNPTAPSVNPTLMQWSGDSERWTEEKKLQSMTAALRTKVQNVLLGLKERGFQPKIFYGWRSIAVQLQLYSQGHSKVKFSFHNAQTIHGMPNSYAADIIDTRYGWLQQAETFGFWKALGEESKKQGLYWGGDWASFRDWAHVQLVPNSHLSRVKLESGL